MATANNLQPKKNLLYNIYLFMLCESGREEKKKEKTHQVPLVRGLFFLLLVFNSSMLKTEQNGNSFLFYRIDTISFPYI